MEKISWTDCVRNEDQLHSVKEERNILHTIKRMKAVWFGHILRRNCLLNFIEGKIEEGIEVMGKQGGRCEQLLYDVKETRGYRKLREEALCGELALEEVVDLS
jgi:hypothetical protein